MVVPHSTGVHARAFHAQVRPAFPHDAAALGDVEQAENIVLILFRELLPRDWRQTARSRSIYTCRTKIFVFYELQRCYDFSGKRNKMSR